MVRAIDFTDHMSFFTSAETYTKEAKEYLKSSVDTSGDGAIQVNELVNIGFKEDQAIYLINKYGAHFGNVDVFKESGEGIIFALHKLDAYDGIASGAISANALQNLSNEINTLKESDPTEHTRLTTKPGEYKANEDFKTAFDTFIKGQKQDPSAKDINLNKSGANVSDSMDAFLNALEADGNGALDEGKLRLLGFTPQGIKCIAETLGYDITSKDDLKKLLIFLDGNGDGIIRKADIQAINNGIDSATCYLPSVPGADAQPEGEDDETAALKHAEEFICQKTSLRGTSELKPLDIDNILFANRPDVMGDDKKALRDSVRNGLIAHYGKDGKLTAEQLAKALVSLDAKSHRSSTDKKYDGIIDAADLEALAPKTEDKTGGSDNTTDNGAASGGHSGSTGGSSPTQGQINRVYPPLQGGGTTGGITVQDGKTPSKKSSASSKSASSGLFGLLNLKTIGLAALFTGLFLKFKQPSVPAAVMPPQPWCPPRTMHAPMGFGTPPLGQGGMMNWIG